MSIAANIIAFQFGWFACVLGGAYGFPATGTAAGLIVVAVHFLRAYRPWNELRLALAAAAIGIVFDGMLVTLDWVRFSSGALAAGPVPLWMTTLWMLFATTLNVSLAWLKGRWGLAALAGAAGGPLAYHGGAGLGAMEFVEPIAATAALAGGWALMMPLLFRLARRYDGITPADPAHIEARHA